MPYYGVLSAAALDPVEKKPLYHFHPGTRSYSIGFFGCNLRCPFCQNYQISTKLPSSGLKPTNPAEVVAEALQVKADSISYTYSEPLIHAEFCLETAAAANDAGLANIFVTNGYMSEDAAKSVFSAMDAVNIDLKSFNPQYYEKVLKGGLETVCKSIETAATLCHTEVTTLLIPGENDSRQELDSLFSFLSALKPQPVLHLTRYFPRHQYTQPATSVHTLQKAGEMARGRLKYVYIGNTGPKDAHGFSKDTVCPECDSLLISRKNLRISVVNSSTSNCDNCGSDLPYLA